MALYKPDYKLAKAKRVLSELEDSDKKELIEYLISKKDETIENQRKKLKEYSDWFEKLDMLLPNKNTVYK